MLTRIKQMCFVTLLILLTTCLLAIPACNCKEESSTATESMPTSTVTSPTTTPVTETTVVSTPEPLTTTPEQGKGKSFIWKISLKSTSVYLLGSIHYGKDSLYPLDRAINDAFELADKLAVEIDITDEGSEVATAQLVLQYGTYPQGGSLKNNIPEKLYTELKEEFRRFGIEIAMLDTFKPWVISLTLSQLIFDEMGYDPQLGIDYTFLESARIKQKDVVELETIEYQIQVLSSIPDEVMILSLQDDMENMPTQEEIEVLFTAWADGDIAEVESMLYEALDRNPALAPLYEKTYDERNLNMAQKIEEFLAGNEVYFIIVGAGHLVGNNGLINIMLEKGYKVEQL